MNDPATKATLKPALKETYSTAFQDRAHAELDKVKKARPYDNARICPGCGRKRLGSYCRDCGEATMPHPKSGGSK